MPLFGNRTDGGVNIEWLMAGQYEYIDDPEESCCVWKKFNTVIIEDGKLTWFPGDIENIKNIVIWDSRKGIEKVLNANLSHVLSKIKAVYDDEE